MSKVRYFIYCRKSSEEGSKQVQSLDTQERINLELASKNDLVVVDIIRESKSARIDGNRPLFSRMIDRIRNGEASGIIVVHADRLSRNLIEAGQVVKQFDEGFLKEVRTPMQIYNTPQSMFYMGFDFVGSSQFSRDLSHKVRDGNQSKLLSGEYPSYAPEGYVNVTHGIVPSPLEGKWVSLAFREYSQGTWSVKRLAKHLNGLGYRTRTGKRIASGKLHRVLTNPEYYGVIERKGKIYPGKHEPLVTKAVFDTIQLIIKNRHRGRKQNHHFTYRDYLTCGECGCKITAGIAKGKYTYYRCTNGRGRCLQHKKYLSEGTVKNLMSQVMSNFTLDEEMATVSLNQYKQELESKHQDPVSEKLAITAQLATLDKRLSRLEEMYLDEKISSERYDKRRNEMIEEKVTLTQAMKKINQDKLKTTLEHLDNVKYQACTFQKMFIDGDDSVRRDLVKALLWNADIKDGQIVDTRYRLPFALLAGLKKTDEIANWRRRWDSNPRDSFESRVSNPLE